jgi:hypothetical protein
MALSFLAVMFDHVLGAVRNTFANTSGRLLALLASGRPHQLSGLASSGASSPVSWRFTLSDFASCVSESPLARSS